jgi:hypothetical protein
MLNHSLKSVSLFSIILMLLFIVVVPRSTSPAHAALTGLICLEDVTTAPLTSPCIAPAPIFDAPLTSPIHQIKVGVFINGSDGFDGFDIILKANSSVLKPAGIDFSGSLFTQPVIAAECLGTTNLLPSNCMVPTADTLELAAAKYLPLTPTPSTGLLFTAIYNVTGTTGIHGMSIGFQTGCGQTSVAGGVCVTIANGTPLAAAETVQPAFFNNTIPMPYLAVASTSIGGVDLAQTARTFSVSLSTVGDWSVLCPPCTITLSTIHDSGLTVNLNTTSVSMTGVGSAHVSINVTGAMAGNYSATIFAQYASLDSVNFAPDTLVAHWTFRIQVTDFTLSAIPTGFDSALVGTSLSSTLTISGLNGFSGSVDLSSSLSQCTPTPTAVLVPGSSSSQLTCSWNSSGNYTVTVTGTVGGASHTLVIPFRLEDFAVSLSSTSVSFGSGSGTRVSLVVSGLNGFSQGITVTASAPNGLTVSPSYLSLGGPGTVSLSLTSSSPGTYNVTVTVSSGGVSHSTNMQVTVEGSSSGSSNLFGIPITILLGLLAAIGTVVAVAVGFGLRRRRPELPSSAALSRANGTLDFSGLSRLSFG